MFSDVFFHTDFKDLKDGYAIRYAVLALQGRVLCPSACSMAKNTVCVIGEADIFKIFQIRVEIKNVCAMRDADGHRGRTLQNIRVGSTRRGGPCARPQPMWMKHGMRNRQRRHL